jgi:hypothetical protein
MEDSSKDLPKPPRITAARPFFSPRPSSGEGVTGPLELSRRRAAQLFTPPGSSLTSESAAKPESSPVSDAEVHFDGDWSAAPTVTPERTLDAESLLSEPNTADDDRLVVEMYEHEEIELKAAASNTADEHSIEVIAYDDANSLLRAAADEGKHPQVDGLQLETTEFSFEQESPPPRMSVDSFWANEPFVSAEASKVSADASAEAASEADDTESTIDAATATEAERQAMPASETEPEPAAEMPAAEVPAAMFADIAPPWRNRLTPVSSPVLEEIKDSEPWELAPPRGFESDPAEIEADAPAAESWSMDAVPLHMEPVAAVPSVAEPSVEEPFGHHIADALVRIAARVRTGELEVPPCAEISDEAALSVVLTSLLRMRH